MLTVIKTGKAVRYAIIPDALRALWKYLASGNESGFTSGIPD
jgi:hypothetical protein